MFSLLTFIIISIPDDLREYFNALFDPRNPVVLSLILLAIIVIVIILAFRNTVLPKQNKMQLENIALEASNMRLMAIFAELDPDPVLRIDNTGSIIFVNPAAKEHGFYDIIGKPVTNIISVLKINPEEFIKFNKEISFPFYFQNRYYSVLVKGINNLNIAQFYMHDITELKAKEEELSRSQAELKEFSKYLQQKIEEERKRLARELHDDIGQKMVLLKLNMQKDFLNLTQREDSPEMMRNDRLLESITSDIKEIAHSLVPSKMEEIGLQASLINLIESFNLQSSISGNIEFDNLEERLDINLEISIYRIIQEAVNNIIKYSKAKDYFIELSRKPNYLRLIVADDGMGFDLSNKSNNKGMGLRNMQERAGLHGGTFKIITSPNQGTVIKISFPIGG